MSRGGPSVSRRHLVRYNRRTRRRREHRDLGPGFIITVRGDSPLEMRL